MRVTYRRVLVLIKIEIVYSIGIMAVRSARDKARGVNAQVKHAASRGGSAQRIIPVLSDCLSFSTDLRLFLRT